MDCLRNIINECMAIELFGKQILSLNITKLIPRCEEIVDCITKGNNLKEIKKYDCIGGLSILEQIIAKSLAEKYNLNYIDESKLPPNSSYVMVVQYLDIDIYSRLINLPENNKYYILSLMYFFPVGLDNLIKIRPNISYKKLLKGEIIIK